MARYHRRLFLFLMAGTSAIFYLILSRRQQHFESKHPHAHPIDDPPPGVYIPHPEAEHSKRKQVPPLRILDHFDQKKEEKEPMKQEDQKEPMKQEDQKAPMKEILQKFNHQFDRLFDQKEDSSKQIESLKQSLEISGSLSSKNATIMTNCHSIAADLERRIADLSRRIDEQTRLVEKLGASFEGSISKRCNAIIKSLESLNDAATSAVKGLVGNAHAALQEMINRVGTEQVTSAPKQRSDFYRTVLFKEPPISTVTCFGGNSTTDRVCKVKMLCYDPTNDHFFIFKDPHSLENGVPQNRSYLVDMTSIDGHNRFYFDYHDVHPDRYEQRELRVVDKLTFIFSRFHTYNIMHTIHDDLIGAYINHRIFAPSHPEDPEMPFSTDTFIFLADSFGPLRYDNVLGLLSEHPLRYRETFRASLHDRTPLCFRDAVVGNNKLGSWYTYGFLEPQGPIANKTVSGLLIRDVASWMMKRFGMPAGWEEAKITGTLRELEALLAERRKRNDPRSKLYYKVSSDTFITIFSRRIDRLILNEAELGEALGNTYGLPVRSVRMEDMGLAEQIAILRNTVIAVGMHGSALILSIFLPPGALLVELYPYAVPKDNYTPYKTLAGLSGFRLAYRSWNNTHPANNYPHPEKPAAGGGILHLSESKQREINETLTVPPHLCCADPFWLYRIYQDTRVDLDEVMDLIDDGIPEALKLAQIRPQDLVYVRPGSIEQVYCRVRPSPTNQTSQDLLISWTLPWNGVIPSYFGVWIHQPFKEFIANDTSLVLPDCVADGRYDVWVRPYVTDPISGAAYKGAYSDKFTCTCQANAVAKRAKVDEL